ncbi:MAG: cupin domain-containing protein [Acidiferrobacter sp.]
MDRTEWGPCAARAAYVTKDGSEICELWHPDHHGTGGLSLARATIPAGEQTRLHRHVRAEEVYHVLSGSGVMDLGSHHFMVRAGDTVHISPGIAHRVSASAEAPLVILCCCTPPYRHDDTEILS